MDGNFHMNFWPLNGDCVNQRIVRIRDNTNVSVLQIYYSISPSIKKIEKQVARSTVGHLSDKDMKGLQILIPNVNRPYEIFDSILTEICANKRATQKLIELRDSLLPLLINGQLNI